MYALFIMIIVTIIIASVILLSYINHIERNSYRIEDKLRTNVNSGIALMLADRNIIEYGQLDSISLFSEYNNDNIISINKELWGLYDKLHCKANWGRFLKEKIALSGDYYKNKESIALYLADTKNPLCLVGKALIKGNCFIPKAGIKHGYVEGRHYERDELPEGKSSLSDSILPLTTEKIKYNSLNSMLSRISIGSNLEISNYSDIEGESITNSFYNTAMILYETGDIFINKTISGNMIIVSEEDIVIGRNSSLKDILVYGKNIVIESGFSGSIQCFARDTILVEQNCNLTYPSALATINLSKTENKSMLGIKSGVQIEGTVLQYSLFSKRFSKPAILISEDALIIGQVYSTSSMELLGNVYGSLFSNMIVLSKPSARYINHLMDVEINLNKLPEWFVGNSLVEEIIPAKIIKWL